MERGPMALFGAIIAVGLGPALWLGAQFGHTAAPMPPTVINVESTRGNAPGRAGAAVDEAGLESTDRAVQDRADRRRVLPNPTTTPPAAPSSSPPLADPPPDPAQSSTPPSTAPSPTDSTEPAGPVPTTPSTAPSVEPTGPTASPGSPDTPPVANPGGSADDASDPAI